MNRLFLSAAHKSSGKTTIAVGLAAAFRSRGLDVRPFKKGPDYIDPMWLQLASGRACYNLDFHTQTRGEILAMLSQRALGGDLALIEGNKGLHDGVDLEGRNSSAALAKLTGAPVVLVIDACGMARGVAPLLIGYQKFDPQVRIAGVILNRVGAERQVAKLRQAVERYTDMKVLGAVGRAEALALRERHLGLITPQEAPEAEEIVALTERAVVEGVDLDALLAISGRAPPLPSTRRRDRAAREDGYPHRDRPRRRLRLLLCRRSRGAAAPGRGARVFRRAERCALCRLATACSSAAAFRRRRRPRLEANASLRADMRAAHGGRLPAYAECGGLMYLSRSITWNGERARNGRRDPGRRAHGPQAAGARSRDARGARVFTVGPGASGAPFPRTNSITRRSKGCTTTRVSPIDVRRGFGVDGARGWHRQRRSDRRLQPFARHLALPLDAPLRRPCAKNPPRLVAGRLLAPPAAVASPPFGRVSLVGAGPGDPDC